MIDSLGILRRYSGNEAGYSSDKFRNKILFHYCMYAKRIPVSIQGK